MVGEKVTLRYLMKGSDGHYAGGLVNGSKIVNAWGDVGTELMVRVDGDISLFLGYDEINFTAPIYVGDFMEYTGWIEKVGNTSYKCRFEAYKVACMLDRTDADMTGVASTAATACVPPVLCGTALGSLYIGKNLQRGNTDPAFVREHPEKK